MLNFENPSELSLKKILTISIPLGLRPLDLHIATLCELFLHIRYLRPTRSTHRDIGDCEVRPIRTNDSSV